MATRFLLVILFFPAPSVAAIVDYEFDIDIKKVNITGKSVDALSIDDQIPAPTVRATVGDVLRVTFHNHLKVATSVHWHGILLPADQDGVPYMNTQPIEADGSHTFEFPVRQAGTYWYHSHTDLQIQKGLYGAVILSDDSAEQGVQEELVLFSDWTDEAVVSVLGNLKADSDFYSFKRNTIQSWDKVIENGPAAIRSRLSSSFSRMGPMDLADVGYDAFLVNGKKENSITALQKHAKQIKLRLINGSTSSYFDVEYAGGAMTVIAADGQNVQPVKVKRLRISTAETYDVLVPIVAMQASELRATSIDGSGYSSMYIGTGEKALAPDIPTPNLFLSDSMSRMMDMPTEMVTETPAPGHDHPGMAMAGEVIDHMTDYEALISTTITTLPVAQVWREIPLTLTGNMERYVWSFNGKTAREEPQILIRKGENVRFQLSNETMMHHPLHLHGHFFRVVSQQGERSPLKHTVNVPPMGQVTIEFDANETEDWLFHCHNQYHMKTGMNRVVSYQSTSLFTDEIGRLIQPARRWFDSNNFHAMTSLVDYEFSLSDEHHEFSIEVDADFADSHEVHVSYAYHFHRFLSGFAGIESRQHHHEDSRDVAIAGFNTTLPLLIDSEWRVDDRGEFRLELESAIQISQRLGLDWRWNTDNEYRYGVNYKLNNRWTVTFHTDTEYGNGIGVKFFY